MKDNKSIWSRSRNIEVGDLVKITSYARTHFPAPTHPGIIIWSSQCGEVVKVLWGKYPPRPINIRWLEVARMAE